MDGYTTVTASEGHEFKITARVTGLVKHATTYRDSERPGVGRCTFTPREGPFNYAWDGPDIELVEIAKPEPLEIGLTEEVSEWEIPGRAIFHGKDGDRLRICTNGYFQVLRVIDNCDTVIGSGWATRVQ